MYYFQSLLSALFFNTTPSVEDSEYSIPTWKRVPTTFDVIFGFVLPYTAPKSAFGAFLWRKRVWFETTFALTMMEPWEKILLSALPVFRAPSSRC